MKHSHDLPPRRLMCLLLALSVGLTMPLMGCPKKAQQAYKGPPRKTFYQIDVKLFRGTEMSFRKLYGKVTVIDFFATSCARCEVVQIPLLKRLYQRHQKDGFRVLGVALQPQAQVFLRPFLQVLKLPYPVAIGGKQFTQGRTIFGYIRSIPRSYLIDRCGRIRHFYSGVAKRKELTKHVASLLKEKPNCPQ